MVIGRILAGTVVIGVLFLCTPQDDPPTQEQPNVVDTNAFNNLIQSMVVVKADVSDEATIDEEGLVEEAVQLGSGFYITEDGLILTAFHNIRKAATRPYRRIFIRPYDQSTFIGAYIVEVFEDADLALLRDARMEPPELKYVDIFEEVEINEGMSLYAMGFPADISDGYRPNSGRDRCHRSPVPLYSSGRPSYPGATQRSRHQCL